MRIIILNTDYADFLIWLYSKHPDLEDQSYDEQMRVRNDSLFSVADFYSANLRKLGHEAWDIHVNNYAMQKAWAREHDLHFDESEPIFDPRRNAFRRIKAIAARTPARLLRPLVRSFLASLDEPPPWFYQILSAQIEHHRPDVILVQNISAISVPFLLSQKPCVRLLIGQHAATRLEVKDYSGYDLIVSSYPPTLEFFRRLGVQVEMTRLGFEPAILSQLKGRAELYDLTFVGSLGSVHSSRVEWLESLYARHPQIQIWSPNTTDLVPTSPIHRVCRGPAWGREMYEILFSSKITLNHHGNIAPYASNQRLFEATGVGTLLFTERMPGLEDIFEPGKEIVCYGSFEECSELAGYYLSHEAERRKIARAGQARTLQQHTYENRMQDFVRIVQKYMP